MPDPPRQSPVRHLLEASGATMRDVGPSRYGMAGAGRTTVFQLATAMAIAIGFVLVGEPSGPDEAVTAYQRVALLGAISYGAQALLFGLLYPGRRSAQP